MSLPTVSTLSEAMKPIKKYYLQAKQIENIDPKVTYLCRLHAAKEGLKLKQSPEDLKFIVSLMDWLENNNPMKNMSQEEKAAHLYEFIGKLFYNADQTDRNSPVIDDDLAKCFLSISLLLDVYSQFGPLSEQEQQRRKYCQWKAVEIRKALREGRPHMRGGFGDEEETMKDGSDGGSGSGSSGPLTGTTSFPSHASTSSTSTTPAAATSGTSSSSAKTSTNTNKSSSSSSSALPTLEDLYGDDGEYMWNKSVPKASAKPTKPTAASLAASHQAGSGTSIGTSRSSTSGSSSTTSASKTSSSTSSTSSSSNLQLVDGNLVIAPKPGNRGSAMSASEKLIKHAISAISFDDTNTAIVKLQEALALLLPHKDTGVQY